MSGRLNPRQEARLKRKKRIRIKISGSQERPRLSVFRSSRHIYAQVIDDLNGVTLVTASTMSPEIREQEKVKGKIEDAKRVGKMIADQGQSSGDHKGGIRSEWLYVSWPSACSCCCGKRGRIRVLGAVSHQQFKTESSWLNADY